MISGRRKDNNKIRFVLLSLGVTVSQISLILLGLTDSIMIGRDSSVGLAASTWVSSIYNLGMLFGMGMIIPIAVQIGRADNEKDQERIKVGYYRLVILLTVAISLFLYLFVKVNYLFGTDKIVLEEAQNYALGLIPGILPWITFYLIRNILLCYQKVGLTVLLSVAAIFINIVLNYIFIYGLGSFVGMGAFGGALATSITNYIITLIALWVLRKDRTAVPAVKDIFKGPDPHMKVTWLLGLPTGLMFFSESLIFAAGNTLLSNIDTEAVVAFGIAVSWLNLSYMFPVAMSQVLTEPLSKYYTDKNTRDFKALSKYSLFIVLLYNILWIFLIIIFTDGLITTIVGNNLTSGIYILAERFLYLMAAIMFVYNYIVVFSGILRGFGDVKTPLLLMFVMYWVIGVGGTILLTRFIGAYGVPLGMLIGFGLTFAGIASTYKNKMRGELSGE